MTEAEGADDELEASRDSAARELLSPDDYLLFTRLPDEKRTMAARRLAVLRAWRDPELRRRVFADATDAAKCTGLSRSGFYALVQNNDPPRLVALGLKLGPGEEQPAAFGRLAVMEEAASVLGQIPHIGTSELVRRLQASTGAGMSDSKLVRIVDDARRTAPARAPFGTALAFDAASLDLVDLKGTRQRLYAVCDKGTGLVLGWRVAGEDSYEEGYGSIARAVLSPEARLLGPMEVTGLQVADGPPAVDAAFASPRSFEVQRRMAEAGWRLVLDPRRVGRTVLKTLGRRIGKLKLAAGYAPPGMFHSNRMSTSRLPLVDDAVVEAVGREIARHNELRLSLAARGDGSDAWGMIEQAMKVAIL